MSVAFSLSDLYLITATRANALEVLDEMRAAMATAAASPCSGGLRQFHSSPPWLLKARCSGSFPSPSSALRSPGAAAAAAVEGDVSDSRTTPRRRADEDAMESGDSPPTAAIPSPSFFPKKGQTLELVCESLAFKGKGVCKVADTGFVLMCDRALPGERFIGRVSRKKGNYAEVCV